MRCPRCQAQNRAGAQFCRECGTRLEAVCPACGLRVEPASRFCDACGSPLGTPPATAAAPTTAAPRFEPPGGYTPKHLANNNLTSRKAPDDERKQDTNLLPNVSRLRSLAER